MRAGMLSHVVECRAQVLEEARGLSLTTVGEGHVLVEQAQVAGFHQVLGDREHEPHGVVVEIAPEIVVTFLGERLVLMVAAPVGELHCRAFEETLAAPFRKLVQHAQQVLKRVAEADAAGDAGLEE